MAKQNETPATAPTAQGPAQQPAPKPPMFRIYTAVKKTAKNPSGKLLLTATRAMDAEDAAAIGRMMLAEKLAKKITVEPA